MGASNLEILIDERNVCLFVVWSVCLATQHLSMFNGSNPVQRLLSQANNAVHILLPVAPTQPFVH